MCLKCFFLELQIISGDLQIAFGTSLDLFIRRFGMDYF